MRETRWSSMIALCALAVAPIRATPAQAARRELVGVVREATGSPIDGASVEIRGSAASTDARGGFRLWTSNVDTVTITVRKIGYVVVEALLTAAKGQWDTLVVEMERTAQSLASVNVREERTRRAGGLRTFEERRAKGQGVFITRAEIEARNTSRLSDILHAKRGIRLVRLGPGRYGARFVTYTGSRGTACIPDLWLDGARARGMEIDDVMTNTVEAMELYHSFATVPFEFAHQVSTIPCGTIIIWTRVPGR